MAALGTNMGSRAKKEESSPKKKPKKPTKKVVKKEPAILAKKANTVTKTAKKRPAKVTKKAVTKVVAKASKKISKPPIAESDKAAVASKKKLSVAQEQSKKPTATAQKSKSKPTPKVADKAALRNASIIIEPSKRRKIRKTKVILEGELTINNVDAFMQQIDPIFEDYDYIDFFQRDVTSLDLSHIQMLRHFQNHPTKKSKTVTINSELPTEMKKLMINAGFKELLFIPKLV